jgi:two-component system phosphate regulon sensor histidine kinase PhoR
MCITLLIIIGFQVYWLNDNYNKERRTMQIKTGAAFQQTILHLQTGKLKLNDPFLSDSGPKAKKIINEDANEAQAGNGGKPRREIIMMVNTLRNSIKKDTGLNRTIVVANGKGERLNPKNISVVKFSKTDSSEQVYNILYRIDSLQDSIKIPEISNAYTSALKKESLNIPFTITKSQGGVQEEEPDMSDVTVGFAHPVTYHLLLGNSFPYLFKQIMLPLLFSLFLVGATVLSFVLLYRNLLRQQRLAEIKNEFISNITHELKTPIATVGVAIEALKSFNAIHDKEKTKEYLDISSNELQRLELLVDNVLKLSMFEKKQIALNKEQFDLKELTQKVLDSMRPQFGNSKALVNFSAKGDNFLIKADKLHITSVIYNLLDNALKYCKEDPLINVQLSSQQNFIELRVSDNGIGIAQEYCNKIFDKFFRVPTGNKHDVKGYGLGLSYVSEIIKRHMGFISVESDLNKGSVFTARIPVEV